MDGQAFQKLVNRYERQVTVDIGTGDGLFVYRCAQRNPQRFFIGIDANHRPLEKISEKIYRRPSRGGVPNAIFVQAAVEDLPAELQGIASEVQVQFPWGSLLRGVANGDELVMGNLRRICLQNALLRVTLGVDLERDRFELQRLELPAITIDYVRNVLSERYLKAGFQIVEAKRVSLGNVPDAPELQTSWARRLHRSSSRSFLRIVAEALRLDSLK